MARQGTDWEDTPIVNARNLDAAVGEEFTYAWSATCKAHEGNSWFREPQNVTDFHNAIPFGCVSCVRGHACYNTLMHCFVGTAYPETGVSMDAYVVD